MKKMALYEPPYMIGDKAPRPASDDEAQLRKMIAEGRRDDAVKFFLSVMGTPGFAISIMRIMPFWSRMRAVANSLPYDFAIMGDYSLPADIHETLPHVEERIQYRKPHFLKNGKYAAVITSAKDYVSFTIFNAASIDAPKDLFEGPPERQTIKIKNGQSVDFAMLSKLLAQAS